MSFGRNAKDELAARQTLSAFNSQGDTIEWRLLGRSARSKPVAAIMRWHTLVSSEEGDIHGQVLVVTRLSPGPVCHIGYVDALANHDANEVAQKIADQYSEKFRCGRDERVILGNKGPGFSATSD